MWIKEPGKITDRIDFLGTHQICLYLIKGKEYMIVGGGMSYIAPSLEKQFSAMAVDLSKIKYLVIPHSHFDHCGAVPYLKRKFPQMQILASSYSHEVLAKKKVIEFISSGNKDMIENFGLQDEYERLNLKFDGIYVERIVKEDNVIDLGDGIEAHFIETPGHTKCSIAVYIPELKAMFPSDAAPCPLEDTSDLVSPSPQYDFTLYMESLIKINSYDVEICCFDHHGAFVGDQAQRILRQGLEETEKFKNSVLELYQQTDDLDEITQKLITDSPAGSQVDFLNLELKRTITKAAVHKILGLPS